MGPLMYSETVEVRYIQLLNNYIIIYILVTPYFKVFHHATVHSVPLMFDICTIGGLSLNEV